MVVLIKGIKYKVVLLSKKRYIFLNGDKEHAHFSPVDKQLVFREDEIKKNIIIHEVTHAFLRSLHLSSCSNIDIEDFEEIVCEMLEEHLMDINILSNQILRFLKEKAC